MGSTVDQLGLGDGLAFRNDWGVGSLVHSDAGVGLDVCEAGEDGLRGFEDEVEFVEDGNYFEDSALHRHYLYGIAQILSDCNGVDDFCFLFSFMDDLH